MYSEQAASLPHVITWCSTTAPVATVDRILPDGCLDVIWQDGTLFVAGPDTTAQFHPTPASSTFFGIRFTAGGGPAVLGVPADELTDRRVPLADLWPAAEVRALAEADDPGSALERAVTRRFAEPDPVLVEVVRRARGGRPVEDIADACGLSSRQLGRRVRTAFGYPPKTLVRVLRLQRALRLARRGTPFADTAAAVGCADQAHLAREVRALTGVPLTALVHRGTRQSRRTSGQSRLPHDHGFPGPMAGGSVLAPTRVQYPSEALLR